MTTSHSLTRLERLADLTYRRRFSVVITWIATLAAVLVVVPQFAGEFDVEFGTPGSESKAAADLLRKHFAGSTGDTVNVVCSPTPSASMTSATRQRPATRVTARSGSFSSSSSGSPWTSKPPRANV
jgi:hypothetical protein